MQQWDADQYASNVRFVSELGQGVADLLAPRAGERILDLGCGDGALTEKLVEAGCDVLAVDGSQDMVEAACRRGLQAAVVDGQCLQFDNEFDAVFSNAALHWMKRADDVIVGVRRALRPTGRFVAEFGAGRNVGTIVAALSTRLQARDIDAARVNPWYFPSSDEYRERLEAGGFTVEHMELFERPTPLPGDIIPWLQTFAQTFTGALPSCEQARYLEEVRELLRAPLCDDSGHWQADYVRLRFAARRRA